MATVNFAFLHGGGQGSWVWEETIAAIRAQAKAPVNCLALDVPGCGTKRGRDTAAITFDEIARELIADIEAAGLDDVVLVGHSQAGMPMPRMTEFAPALFRKLVYVTCSAPEPGMDVGDRMGDVVHGEDDNKVGWPLDPKTTTPEERFRVMFCNDMAPADGDAFMAKLGQDMWPVSSYTNRDWRYDHLGTIPATFVLCMQDMALPPVWQQRFAEKLRVNRTVHIDAGHQVMNTRPQALAEVLLAEVAG